MHPDLVYFDLVNKILREGVVKSDRTGTGTISLFGPQVEFDLSEGFPLLTTKKLGIKTILRELLWFIRGDTDLRSLIQKNVNIWTDDGYRDAKGKGFTGSKEDFIEHVKENGYDLGRIYGAQWRSWRLPGGSHIDQLQEVINEIKNNPNSRRLLITAWNPADIPNMTLPPCHTMFQFYVVDGTLSCKMYQR